MNEKKVILMKESLIDSVLSDIFTISLAVLTAYLDTRYIHSTFLKIFIYIIFATYLLSGTKGLKDIVKSEKEAIKIIKDFYKEQK
jgi:hypothetical protein